MPSNKARQRPAVFLDRDGVLIRTNVVDGKPFAIRDGESADILDGVAEACAHLHDAGFLLVMVTNQPDVANGLATRGFVDGVNDRLKEVLALDDIRVCFHDSRDKCACKKPAPGMMLDAAAALDIDLARSIVVGDRWRDVEAGKRAGCQTVFIDCGYSEALQSEPDRISPSLLSAADWIIGEMTKA